jgi:hypothetical protein
MTAARLLRRACSRRGSAAIEEVMALAVILPIVGAATYLGLRMFRMFLDGVAVGVSWPFP